MRVLKKAIIENRLKVYINKNIEKCYLVNVYINNDYKKQIITSIKTGI